jgi:predicted nucleotidyltransferase
MDELTLSHLTPNEQEAIREYLSRVREEFGNRILSASLFGSKARGDDDIESDIDLLLLVDDEDATFRSHLWATASDVSLEHNLVLSVRVFAEARWAATRRMRLPLYRAVEAEGITLVHS